MIHFSAFLYRKTHIYTEPKGTTVILPITWPNVKRLWKCHRSLCWWVGGVRTLVLRWAATPPERLSVCASDIQLAPSSRDYNTKGNNSHGTTPLRTHDKTAALYIIHSPLTWAPVFLLLRFTGATHRRSQNVEPHL